jgi:hypothetical protein
VIGGRAVRVLDHCSRVTDYDFIAEAQCARINQ